MDPNATLAEIYAAWKDSDFDTVSELWDNLLEWLEHGGFEPNWFEYPDLALYLLV
jgi:hypothetical protein